MSLSAADQQRIAEQYPRKLMPKWAFVMFAGLLAALGLIWLIPTALYHASPAASAGIVSFEITSNQGAKFTITVHRADPSRAASCEIIALAENYERVGEITVNVAPSNQSAVEVNHELRTFRRATALEIKGCTAS